jgi:hypothetical protein
MTYWYATTASCHIPSSSRQTLLQYLILYGIMQQHLHGGTEVYSKEQQDTRYVGRDLNLRLSEYETGPQCSVIH